VRLARVGPNHNHPGAVTDPSPQSGFERALLRLLEAVVTAARHRAVGVALAIAALTVAAGGYAARNLGVNADLETLISERVPYMKLRREFDRALPIVDDILLVVVDAPTPERAAEAAETIAARLERQGGTFQGVFVPGGGSFFSRNALLYLSPADLEGLAVNLATAQPYLAEISRDPSVRGIFRLLARALEAIRSGRVEDLDPAELFDRISTALESEVAGRRGPVAWGELVLGPAAVAEESRRLVILSPVLDYSDLQPARKAVEAVRRAADELGYDGGEVRVRLTGDFALSYDEMGVAKRQASGAAVSSFVLVAILLTAALRSLWLIGASLVLLVSGLVLNLGFAAAAVGHLNPISVAFAVLYIGLGVDYAIHFCLHYQDERLAGRPHGRALAAAARDVGSSIVLCAASTTVGFYAFLPTDFKGVAELGLISGTGMIIALILTLTLLPALMTLAPRAVRARWGQPPRGRRIGEITLPMAHPARVLLVTLAIGASALALLPRAYFDSNPLRVRDPHTESVQAFADLLAGARTSPWTLSVLAPDLDAADAVARRLSELPVVDRVVSPRDVVPGDQEEKLEIIGEIALFMGPPPVDGPAPSALETLASIDSLLAEIDAFTAAAPGSPLAAHAARLRAAIAGIRARLESPEAREAELRALQQDLVDPIVWRLRKLHEALRAEPFEFADLPRALRDQLVAVDGRVRVEVFPAADVNDNAALARFVDEVHAVEPRAVGPAGNILNSARIIAASFEEALTLSFVAIGILLFVLWRRLDDTLLVLGILALSSLLTVAVAVVAGIPFNFANVIVLPLLLGACVESSVHLVHRYRHEVSVRGELLRTSTARAVLYTALTTIASFGTLGFATHRGMASMGRLLTIGLLINLACNLVVLPAILNRRSARTR
jgi:hopanoid biosynthesis associated RND transporter like protein HpnN